MNREIVIPGGAGVYPLTGDVQSTAGSPQVKVTGIQGIKVQGGVPPLGSVLTFNQNNAEWEALNNSIFLLNLLPLSDDYQITVNFASIVQFKISVNGVLKQVIYEPASGPVTVNGSPVI
jgi:hypothetical protein